MSQDEIYTFITNKAGKGKQGSLVASIKGTVAKDIISVLGKLSMDKRLSVKEEMLDMAMPSRLIQKQNCSGPIKQAL